MAKPDTLTKKAVNIRVTGIDSAGSYEHTNCYIAVSNDYESHTVIMKKNAKGHWEMEHRTGYPDWVLDREADYVRMAKDEERKTNQ